MKRYWHDDRPEPDPELSDIYGKSSWGIWDTIGLSSVLICIMAIIFIIVREVIRGIT